MKKSVFGNGETNFVEKCNREKITVKLYFRKMQTIQIIDQKIEATESFTLSLSSNVFDTNFRCPRCFIFKCLQCQANPIFFDHKRYFLVKVDVYDEVFKLNLRHEWMCIYGNCE